MKISIFGALGDVGSRIVAEALSRGHDVTAVVRSPEQFSKLPSAARARTGDAGNIEQVAQLAAKQDVIISAIRPPDGKEDQLPVLTKAILNGAAQSNTRVLIIGGAASLKIPEQGETTVMTAPDFLPESALNIARACVAQLDICRADTRANWTYLSPPAMLTPGKRTGTFRLGKDELVIGANGQSAISMEDFAVVLLDEAEQPKHHYTRFTAAY